MYIFWDKESHKFPVLICVPVIRTSGATVRLDGEILKAVPLGSTDDVPST